MQAARSRSSSLPKKPQRRYPSEVDDNDNDNDNDFSEAESPPKKPSSLKAFLTSPMRKSKKVDDMSVQSEQQKAASLKQFLISPMRRASNPKSLDMNMSVGKLDLDAHDHTPEVDSSNNGSKAGGRRTRRQTANEDYKKSPRKDKAKPKTFQQLLGKKNPDKNKSGEEEFANGKKKNGPSTEMSPAQRRPRPPERELSLSPEQQPQKPGSMLTNLLDTLYDSYLDPKGSDDEDEDDFNNLHNSVSRLDMSLSSLF